MFTYVYMYVYVRVRVRVWVQRTLDLLKKTEEEPLYVP